ncbi:TetR/AcrR family transcriptional regulator [Roseibium denhamense]|uniref:DNA-binding transcriptional regulator, AcrR family n=2 Tax=Roseibium denhamense TaxID=76305 RepID=A0ABY1NFR0_9HYPH|nr:TetR/AcrR family transcriptional regulator [Roseibium denhamense]SMP08030.1 DNA-binding transcriptional regulator, AcrR family [Roseibium denhamense]
MATAKTKQKILKTFLDLLSSHSYDDVSLPLVADTAGVKLSDMRAAFGSKRSLVAAFLEKVDAEVLDERDEDMGDQPARDRLFDVLMNRIDALAAHKEAVRSLRSAAKKDTALALDLNQLETRSQKWMLIAAGIDLSGPKAGLVSQGLAIAFNRVVDVWLDEEDEGMPRTMSKLDKELDNGTSFMKRINRLEGLFQGIGSLLRTAADRRGRSKKTASASDDEVAEPV